MARTQTLRVEVVGDTRALQASLSRAQAQLSGFGRASQRLNATLTRGVTAGLKVGVVAAGAGLTFAVKKAADFEQQLSSLGSVAEANGKQMQGLRRQALKAGADTKFSALEAARAQTELAKGGLSVSKIMKGGLKSSLALAAAGEMELADAAEATVNAMKLFGLRGKAAMKVADGFATAANRTTADVSDFAMAMKMGGSAAKASGMNFVETTAALESLAEIGIKGSDAGTSLKAALAQLAAPTAKQKELAKKLNVEFFDQHGNMKSLTDVSRMLGDRLGDLTNKQRLQAVKTLAGTDGMRALLALYDAGPKKIQRFQDELRKEGSAAEVAKKKQDNLKGSLEQLGGSAETLGINVGTLLIPAIRRGADEITDFSNKLSRIAQRDDLSIGEKLAKAFEVAKVDAKPWLIKLQGALERANLPERLGNAISRATPVIAEAAAKGAPVVVGAFIRGWLASDVWGRLAAGAWLFTKMGGRPEFLKVGAQAGSAMGAGMAAGVTAGSQIGTAIATQTISWTRGPGGAMLATVGTEAGRKIAPGIGVGVTTSLQKSGIKDKLATVAKSWGPTLAIAAAATFGPELFKEIKKLNPSAEQLGALKFKEAKEGAESFDQLKASVDRANASFDKTSSAVGGLNPKLGLVKGHVRDVRESFNETAEPVRRVERLIENMATGSSSSVASLRAKVKQNTERIKNALGDDTKAGKDALIKNFRAAVANVRQSMHDGTISTKKGTELIRGYMVEALMQMGFSRKAALNLQKRPAGSTQTPGVSGELRPNQRGSYISEGRSFGDSVPSLLERGEYVLNRKAVRKVGKQRLDALNFGAAPRFQQGGIVELLHPGNDPEGHGDHLHVAMSSVGAIVALGKKLQRLGWLVGEHPAFGGVGGGHAPQGYHPAGQAIDVNWPDPSVEAAKIRALLPMLGGGLGGLMEAAKVAGVTVAGPDSPLKALVQRALDVTRAGAQQKVDALGGSMSVEGAEMSGPWTNVMASIAKSRGWNLGDWRRLVMKESGGNPNARNPSSGAYGLGQFLGATAQQYAKYGALSPDGSDQIRAMAQYISDRYGTPSAALAFHDQNNWYAAGGLVGAVKNTLKKVRAGKSPKLRRGAVDKLLARVRDVGLPDGLAKNLGTHAKNADVFGEFADRAGQLTTEDADGNAIPGLVDGKSQAQWLEQQLEALFKWRNALIRAEEIVVTRRERIAAALAVAVKRKQALGERIRDLEKRSARLGKHPKRNRAELRTVRATLKTLRPQFNALDNRIIPALQGKRSGLNTLRGDLLSNLQDAQGVGSPMTVLKSPPAVGVLGGRIFDAQMRLRDLNAPKPQITDTDSSGSSERDGVFEELARQANVRAAIAESQFDVLKDLPRLLGLPSDRPVLGSLPSYDGGGVVPGAKGSPQPILAHGREVVLTPEQAAAMGGGRPIMIRVVVEDGAVDRNKIRVIADEAIDNVGQTVGLGFHGIRSAPGDTAGF